MSNKNLIPPSSREAEMMVLGCMMVSFNYLNHGIDSLKLSDFYFGEHKKLFTSMANLYKKDSPADVHLICEQLKEDGERINPGFVVSLADYAGTASYFEHYVALVKEKSLGRSLLELGGSICQNVLREGSIPKELLAEAQASFFKLDQGQISQESRSFQEIVSNKEVDSGKSMLEMIREKKERYDSGSTIAINGICSPFTALNEMIDGFGRGNLVIIAGRPSMGKTAFALNLIEGIALDEDLPVAIFSLEMSGEQLAERMLSSRAGVPGSSMKSGMLSNEQFKALQVTAEKFSEKTIIIEDCPVLTIENLKSRARRMKEVHGIQLLVVDYLQLLTTSKSGTSDNRQQEVSEISRSLKSIARELKIPVIALSQLSRKVEERANHMPMMSDLRESGSIEQDADLIIFLYRKEYYDHLDKPGNADLIVAKNRHGAIGTVSLGFQKEMARFTNYEPIKF